MSQRIPFDPKHGGSENLRSLGCEEWEPLLADALDGTLPPADAAAFELHAGKCPACAELLASAKQGRDWLHFLHVEPEVPADLLPRILASTSGRAAGNLPGAPLPQAGAAVAAPIPVWSKPGLAASLRRFAEPRLMMTWAMAFFSIALTLNMAGIRLGAMRLSDLRPSTMGVNLRRQFYSANARVARYYDSLRFVYEMEARMRELRRSADIQEQRKPSQPAQQPEGGSRKGGGKSEGPHGTEPQAILWGAPTEARLKLPSCPEESPAPDAGNCDPQPAMNVSTGPGHAHGLQQDSCSEQEEGSLA